MERSLQEKCFDQILWANSLRKGTEISLENLSVGATRINLTRDLGVIRSCHKFGKKGSDTEMLY